MNKKKKHPEPDYIIEDEKKSEDHTAQNRSGFLLFAILLILVVVPPSLILYENFTSSYSIENLAGWYEGDLTFETSENDPEGYYDKYPEYLIAGKIPVVFRVEATEGSEGKLTIIDATFRRSDLEYRIWIEDGKLIGEPIDLFRDVETRLDLFGEIGERDEIVGLEGSLGIKDLNNEAVAVFNFNADRKEKNLEVEFVNEHGMGLLVKRFQEDDPIPDLSGLWLDMAPKPGIRFALFNQGSAYDPIKSLKIDFDQPSFILMYLDEEYEVLPYSFDGKNISGTAEYMIMNNGKIFVTSDQGSYLIDETVFSGDQLIKVKLGDIDQTQISRKILIDMSGVIEIEGNAGYLYMDVEIEENAVIKTYELMFQLLDV